MVREKFGAGRGPIVALNAHGDVVPPARMDAKIPMAPSRTPNGR